MKLIAITGGIASGKSSFVKDLRQELGYSNVDVVDADAIAHEIVAPGKPAHRQLLRAFGPEYFDAARGGLLLREKLGGLVFSDARARAKLNKITHPKIRMQMLWKVAEAYFRGRDVVLLDIPLLIESGLHRFVSTIIVVTCPNDVQERRLIERNNLPVDQARARIQSQMPMEVKIKFATHVVDNSGDRTQLRDRAAELARRLRPPRWVTWFWLLLPSVAAAVLFFGVRHLLRVTSGHHHHHHHHHHGQTI